MVLAQRLTEAQYLDLILHDDYVTWELWDGEPREKSTMSVQHGDASMTLGAWLYVQGDREGSTVRRNHAKARLNPRNFYIPDVAVIPTRYFGPNWRDPSTPDAYAGPLPLVVEIWSPTTGDYDVAVKLRGYQERFDEEIWYLHPYDRTLTRWLRQADGAYAESVLRGGVVALAALPNVTIDLDALFAG